MAAAASAAEKEASQQSSLGAYSPVDYMSITSFPRLPEDEASGAGGAAESCLRSRKEEDAFLAEQDTDPDSFLKSARLQRLPSSSSEMGSQDVSPLRETTKDPFSGDCSCRQDGLTVIITACLTFATGVTVALIMQIYFGDPQIFHQGAVVTDAAHCTALGIEVLNKQGSSVDAAITSALCSGIINPHTAGIGGGGVMLVHDIRKNESRVIDFRETAPFSIQEEGLRKAWETKPGLLVGVPGMIKGLHEAHQSYGRLPWRELLGFAADVAEGGFNVTHDLAMAIEEVRQQHNYSEKFRKTFLPDGQPLLPGTFMKRPDLAALLNLLGSRGVSVFYSGNVTEEIISEVRNFGGTLSEEDFSNYTVLVENPVHTVYQGHLVLSPSPPHVGPALITALNILEGFNITSQVARENILHWMAETLKIVLALASSLGDPFYDASVSHIAEEMMSQSTANLLRQLINDSQSSPPDHHVPHFSIESGPSASQVLVMGPDDYIVAIVSSLNRPFGSGIMTSSGILLNSQMLDFSWVNSTGNHTLRNFIQPGKRPLSFLLPTVVRPSEGMCGTYLCLGANGGEKALSSITQVLVNVLTYNKNLSESLSLGRLHPQLHPNVLEVDSEFPEEDMKYLRAQGQDVERVEVLSLVHGARRTNNFIIGVKDPRSMDAEGATIL
ncbi:glutathione hydrolase 7 [Eublepharis macularius]|uniref:Glutathione hydrolase n=1 Tax=Eublepharis macularius TaxID=481883 RepID=A0AA97JGC0_EUBMA|nr:glutathione hydrolase 7 [Eublepharis macularius]